VRRPDFFIVGAMKSGTTALYEYLRAHPQLFMCVPKEPMYFGRDLTPRFRRMTEQEYLSLFTGARPDQLAGEATPLYLSSTTAAREIAEFSPAARIIIMLRNPIDVMHAQHGQLVYSEREDITDFEQALAAEPERRQGRRVPTSSIRPESLHYRQLVRFAEQVRRYLDVFGRERVHIIVFDDFVADTGAAYRAALRFLGVDPDVQVDLGARNSSQRARSRLLQRMIHAPPPPLRALYGRLRGVPAARRLRELLVAGNSRRAARQPIDPGLRRRLAEELAPEVAELGELIGRDLSAWSRVEAKD
jgi:hypothetical protein